MPEYWIIDIDSRLVERWRPDDERPEILGERLTWEPAPGEASLDLDLRILARTVLEVLTRRGIAQPGRATVDDFQGTTSHG